MADDGKCRQMLDVVRRCVCGSKLGEGFGEGVVPGWSRDSGSGNGPNGFSIGASWSLGNPSRMFTRILKHIASVAELYSRVLQLNSTAAFFCRALQQNSTTEFYSRIL